MPIPNPARRPSKRRRDSRLRRLGETSYGQFRRIVTVLIAGTALLGTAVQALRVDASARGATADRDARAFLIKAVGKGNAGTQRYALERSMMAEFQTLVTEGSIDLRLAQESPSRGEAQLHLDDAARLGLLREGLRNFSSLLNPPYYDAKSGAIDVLRFGADYLVAPPVKWTEMQAVKAAEASAWSDKSARYVLVITILAVSLFLFGLSLTLGGRVRFLFAGLGCLIVAAAFVATAVTALIGTSSLPEGAIASYVEGRGYLYTASMLALSGGDCAPAQTAVLKNADLAIASFSQALVLERDYAAAGRALGETHLLVGQTLLFGQGGVADPEQARVELGEAVDLLTKAAKRMPADPRVQRELGWADFLAGEYGQAVSRFERALALAPDLEFDLGLNIAVGLIAESRPREGSAELERALEWTAAHPLASDPLAFRAMIHNLDRLMDVRPVVGLDAVRKRLREAFVSVAYRRTCAVSPTPASIGPLSFTSPVIDVQGRPAEGNAVQEFPGRTSRVDIHFDYAGMPKGCQLVQKVLWQGKEAPWLTRVVGWTGPDAGRALLSVQTPVTGTLTGLNPGRYVVEVYVDGNFLRAGEFEISPP